MAWVHGLRHLPPQHLQVAPPGATEKQQTRLISWDKGQAENGTTGNSDTVPVSRLQPCRPDPAFQEPGPQGPSQLSTPEPFEGEPPLQGGSQTLRMWTAALGVTSLRLSLQPGAQSVGALPLGKHLPWSPEPCPSPPLTVPTFVLPSSSCFPRSQYL